VSESVLLHTRELPLALAGLRLHVVPFRRLVRVLYRSHMHTNTALPSSTTASLHTERVIARCCQQPLTKARAPVLAPQDAGTGAT
jgi:hypothetical protein